MDALIVTSRVPVKLPARMSETLKRVDGVSVQTAAAEECRREGWY